METIQYPLTVDYLSLGRVGLAPALEVELIRGTKRAKAVGILDSGSPFTIFSREFAELLGIDDLETGEHDRAATGGGPVDFYYFEVEMGIHIGPHDNRFNCRVGFFPERKPRNILGRNYLFNHYDLGFQDRLQRVLFRPAYS